MLRDYPLVLYILIFGIAAAGVWFAGARLSRYADVLAERTGMGHAFAGVLLLGIATSLPEIATTGTAAFNGNAVLAGNNLLGGVAMQLVVLALADLFVFRGSALTFFSPRPVLLIQGIFLAGMLTLAASAIATRDFNLAFNVGAWPVVLGIAYVFVIYSLQKREGQPRWEPSGEVAEMPGSARDMKDLQMERYGDVPLRSIMVRFALFSLVVLAAGSVVSISGEAIAEHSGLGSGVIGATLVAFATSLPEISTTFTAVRIGAYSMAFANIVGTNAIEVALFLPADILYRDGIIFRDLGNREIFLALLGILLTCIYIWGILERRDRTILGMGVDSFAVLLVYAAGMTLLPFTG